MSETQTMIRGPHDIRKGERYAYKSGNAPWRVDVAGISNYHRGEQHRIVPPDELPDLPDGTVLVNLATGRRHDVWHDHGGGVWIEKRADVRESWNAEGEDVQHMLFALISLPDEPELPETVDREPRVGDMVVCVDDSDLPAGLPSHLVKGHTYRVKASRGCWVHISGSGLHKVGRRKERFRVLASQPADGSFHRPWAFEDRDRDGWSVGMSSNFRIHSQDGQYENANGPYQVNRDGKRYWDDGSILAPNVFSDDLPGGGRDEAWSHGFEAGDE